MSAAATPWARTAWSSRLASWLLAASASPAVRPVVTTPALSDIRSGRLRAVPSASTLSSTSPGARAITGSWETAGADIGTNKAAAAAQAIKRALIPSPLPRVLFSLARVERSTGEEVRNGTAEVGLGDGAHMVAGDLDIARVGEQPGEVFRRAVVVVVRALECERGHRDRRELRLGRIDEAAEQRQQSLGVAAGGLEKSFRQPFRRAALVSAEPGQYVAEV